MKPRILNIDEVQVRPLVHGDCYESHSAWVSAQMSSRKLGFNVTLLPPGKRAWPFHAHRANEEMFFVLEGEGSIRLGDETRKIRKGDFISLPPGPDSGHQIMNDSGGPLQYLAVSTMESPEVVEYPDSGKLGIFAGEPPGRPATGDSIRRFIPANREVGYWEGEE